MAPASRFRVLSRWLLSVILLSLVGGQLAHHWADLGARPIAPSPGWIALALGLLAVFNLVGCECWRRWVLALGTPMPYPVAFRILFVSNLTKYLPGGIWNYVDRAVLLRDYGVSTAHASASMVFDVACQLAAALMVGLLALAFLPLPGAPAWAGLGLAAILLGLHPRLLNAGLGVAGRLLRRPLPRFPFSYGHLLAMIALYAVNWSVLGLGFAALAQGLSALPLAPDALARAAGGFSLAWMIGTLTPLAPAGLGTREAALVAILTPWMPPALPAILAIAARIWLMVGEVVMFAIASALPPPPTGTSP